MKVIDLTDMTDENTKRLNEIADEIKNEYSKFVDLYCEKYDNLFFWATPFASRNTANDSTFIRICRILLIKSICEREKVDLVICETDEEARCIRACVSLDTLIEVKRSDVEYPIVSKFVNFILEVLRTECRVFAFLFEQIRVVLLSRKYSIEPTEEHDFVITHFLCSYISENEYYDRYFADIQAYTERKLTFLPIIIRNTSISISEELAYINSCKKYKFFVFERFIKLVDFAQIIRYFQFCKTIRKDYFEFLDMDLSPLVSLSLKEGRWNSTTMIGLLFERALKRMKRKGIKANSFVVWYEGRPNDILEVSAIRKYYPNAKCVGYESYPLAEFNLALSISQYQYYSKHAPNCMSILGSMYVKQATQFCSELKVFEIPSYRQDFLFENYEQFGSDRYRILVVLSYSTSVSKELIDSLNSSVTEMSGVDVVFKNHPINWDYELKDYGCAEALYEYEFQKGNLTDSMRGADAVIMSATSASLEVIFKNLPLIVFCPKGELRYTCLPTEGFEDMYSVVYNASELKKEILHAKSRRIDNSRIVDCVAKKNRENTEKLF